VLVVEKLPTCYQFDRDKYKFEYYLNFSIYFERSAFEWNLKNKITQNVNHIKKYIEKC